MGILELKFFKENLNTPWGFRLVGGADYNEALVVVKVNDQSLASSVGLKLGDVIVRLNNIPTAGLTREDVHDLINQSGDGFSMVVRRGLFYDLTSSTDDDDDDEESSELAEILCNSLKEPAKDYDEFGPPPKLFENLAGQETLVDNNNSSKLNNNDDDIQRAKKSKKWSTFLVKPKNRKPVPKQEEEARKILGDPYKVKIIKQPRRNPNDVLNHRKSVQFEPLVTEVEISPRDSSATNSVDSLDERNMMEVEIETSVEINEETSVEVDEDDDAANEDQYTVDVVEEENEEGDECTIKKLKPILKAAPLDIHLDPSIICESSLSLEDQLAAVQRQLLALSQLPSAIQITLEAVTNQLNKIVLEKVNPNNNNNNIKENGMESDHYQQIDEENSADEIDGDSASDNNNAEGDLTENEDLNNFDDEFDEECVAVNGNEENLEDATINNNNEKDEAEEEESADPYAGLTEEEKEAKLREEELEYKKQKILEERRKMDWTERPIVLPGGRKWSDAEDVVPKYRQPKMSDEKISKAIEDHSEVIVGKTKGINFLKFEPPPKNLDYLQKSEVYRLIHDMEPPVRGVGARAEKILSENDYYGDKGAP